MLSAKKSELQATHFTFGNDEPCLKSTYALDFCSQIPNVIPKPLVRPNPAEIIPSHTDVKWMSSNSQDFSNFPSINKDIYHSTMKEYEQTKRFSIRGDVWRSPNKLPPISNTSIDYGEPLAPCINATFDLLRKIQVHHRRTGLKPQHTETEAMHAFRWPYPDQIKPVFQYSKEKKQKNFIDCNTIPVY